jgi:hypothetical protein
MITFGKIKTKIESTTTSLYGKPEFKSFMTKFKSFVLENKDIAEIFYIYDDLSQKKGMDNDLANDYINESIEYCQILIESNTNKLRTIDNWLNRYTNEKNNNYQNIDNTVYLNSIKDLETVLESKKKIKTILTENVDFNKDDKKGVQLPISTMVNIANKKLSSEIEGLSESDKKELKSILSIDYNDLKKEINSLKEDISSKLKNTLNESKDSDLTFKIKSTLDKVMESKNDHYNLYKLRKLNSGL